MFYAKYYLVGINVCFTFTKELGDEVSPTFIKHL